jgi:hypothetical protein
LGLSPAILDITMSRGESLQRQITVANVEKVALAVRVYAENFEASDPFGGIKFNTDSTKQYSSSSWLTINNPSLILAPGEQTKLNFTVTAPADAEPGGHYSVLFFEPLSPTSDGTRSQIGISQRVGALLFITVRGDNIEQGQVLGASTSTTCSGLGCSFKTAPFHEWGPVPFTFNFQNTGNIHVRVTGRIQITDMFGHLVGNIPVPEETVLPGSTRNFSATWLRDVLFGRYQAKLSITYGSVQRSETATIVFWAIPWRAILSVVGAIALGIATALLTRIPLGE